MKTNFQEVFKKTNIQYQMDMNIYKRTGKKSEFLKGIEKQIGRML